MDDLFQKITRVESELADLRRSADRLSLTVAHLKKQVEKPFHDEMPVPAPLPPASRAEPPPLTADGPAEPETVLPLPAAVEAKSSPQSVIATETSKKAQDGKSGGEAPAPSASGSRDFEMQLGRVWSVRLGIVLLTTGFIFLSRYTYDAVIRDLGPGVRLAAMYLLSFILTGAGLFFERWSESLKNYGRVVAAGGLAAIYYCGYAAYHVESLKVIDSPVVASLLLFVSAGLFCGMSLWRDSRTMLSASLALAFYSVAINPIGWLGCLSALILAGFGIVMMVRHRWFEVGFLVLIGSYLSFFWWQIAMHFGYGGVSHWYLPAYWLLFAAGSLASGRNAGPKHHLIFTSINNAAFFLLFSFRPASGEWMENHDLFCFIFGGILMGLSIFTKNRFPEKSRLAHLVKGLGLITLGFALMLDGYQLFLVLILEAITIMAVNLKKANPATIMASWAVALLSALPLLKITPTEIHPGVWIIGALAWLVLGILHRIIESDSVDRNIHAGAFGASLISLALLFFGLMPGWNGWDQSLTLGSLGTLAAGLSLVPLFRHRAPETLAIFLAGGFLALTATTLGHETSSMTQLLTGASLLLVSSVPLALFARKSDGVEVRQAFHLLVGLFLILILVQVGLSVEQMEPSPSLRLLIYLGIPLLGTLVAGWTRLRAHALVPFAMQLALLFDVAFLTTGEYLLGCGLTLLHFVVLQVTPRVPNREILRPTLIVIASLFWGGVLVTGFDEPAVPFALSATVLFIAAARIGRIIAPMVALPYFLLGLLLAFLSGSSLDLYLCLLPLFILHLVRSFRRRHDPLTPLTIGGLLLFWFQVTSDAGDAPLAAVWGIAGTLLLLTGLGLKSRPFRLIGLIVLACSLGHLMLVDVVKLAALPRILSFMTLGVGLLGLGFVYNRFQDRLKEFL